MSTFHQTPGHRGSPKQSPIINDDQARRLRHRHAQKQNQPPPPASPLTWTYERFGLRWHGNIDIMNVSDAPGVFVMFFKNNTTIIVSADNLYRSITQYWRAPGPTVQAFSWIEVNPPEAREFVRQSMFRQSYDQLWEDIRPVHMRD